MQIDIACHYLFLSNINHISERILFHWNDKESAEWRVFQIHFPVCLTARQELQIKKCCNSSSRLDFLISSSLFLYKTNTPTLKWYPQCLSHTTIKQQSILYCFHVVRCKAQSHQIQNLLSKWVFRLSANSIQLIIRLCTDLHHTQPPYRLSREPITAPQSLPQTKYTLC